MTSSRAVLGATVLGVFVAAGLLRCHSPKDAEAQRIDPRRPTAFVVGPPPGPAPMIRVDGQRRGLARDPLPNGRLRIAWRKTIGVTLDQPVLAAADGVIAAVTTRGDVVFLDADGEELGKAGAGGSTSSGLAAITSDGTIVLTNGSGEAVGLRRSSPRPRFLSRIGGERNVRAAPLSLADGGIVVATATDLVVLDAEGGVRGRVTLPESPAAPLLAAGERVLAVTASGAIYGWIPGREAVLLGSFGSRPDGAVALVDAQTLLGVVDGQQLVEVLLTTGARSTRAVAAGLFLGPPAVHSQNGGTAISLLKVMPNLQAFAATIDASGAETRTAAVATLSLPALPDGGVSPLSSLPHDDVGLLVDARGAIAFAAPDGSVGLVAADGSVSTIGERLCSPTRRSAGITGLTPLGQGAFAVTCEAGVVVRIEGADVPARPSRGGNTVFPARPASPPTPPEPRPAVRRPGTPASKHVEPDDD